MLLSGNPDLFEEGRDLSGQTRWPRPQLERRAGGHEPGVRQLTGEVGRITEWMDQIGPVGEHERGALIA